MKTIRYAGGSFVTSDASAKAILDYGAALGQRSRTDSITVPCLLEDGKIDTTTLLIGPASEMIAEPLHGAEVDLGDTDTVANLLERCQSLTHPEPVIPAEDVSDYPALDINIDGISR